MGGLQSQDMPPLTGVACQCWACATRGRFAWVGATMHDPPSCVCPAAPAVQCEDISMTSPAPSLPLVSTLNAYASTTNPSPDLEGRAPAVAGQPSSVAAPPRLGVINNCDGGLLPEGSGGQDGDVSGHGTECALFTAAVAVPVQDRVSDPSAPNPEAHNLLQAGGQMAPDTGRQLGQEVASAGAEPLTPAARLADDVGLPVPPGKVPRGDQRPSGAERLHALRLRVAARAAAAQTGPASETTATTTGGEGLVASSSGSRVPTTTLPDLPAQAHRLGGRVAPFAARPSGLTQGRDDPLAGAIETMSCVFGMAWRERFHRSHQLSLAAPLVYCRVCGHYCGTSQHLTELGSMCSGPPNPAMRGNVERLRRLSSGWSPRTGGPRLERAVPLPAGTRGQERPRPPVAR